MRKYKKQIVIGMLATVIVSAVVPVARGFMKRN